MRTTARHRAGVRDTSKSTCDDSTDRGDGSEPWAQAHGPGRQQPTGRHRRVTGLAPGARIRTTARHRACARCSDSHDDVSPGLRPGHLEEHVRRLNGSWGWVRAVGASPRTRAATTNRAAPTCHRARVRCSDRSPTRHQACARCCDANIPFATTSTCAADRSFLALSPRISRGVLNSRIGQTPCRAAPKCAPPWPDSPEGTQVNSHGRNARGPRPIIK
jgi:hypothetical protein